MTETRASDVDEFDEEDTPPIEQCVVFDGERVHFTQPGIARFRARFARAGIDIRAITNRDQLAHALEASFPSYWEAEVAKIAAKRPRSHRERIERACLVAIALGDNAEMTRLKAILDRLNKHPLSLVRTPE